MCARPEERRRSPTDSAAGRSVTVVVRAQRLVIQRVHRAHVSVDGDAVGAIERGVCVLVGIGDHDSEADFPAMSVHIPHACWRAE